MYLRIKKKCPCLYNSSLGFLETTSIRLSKIQLVDVVMSVKI